MNRNELTEIAEELQSLIDSINAQNAELIALLDSLGGKSIEQATVEGLCC